MTTEEGLRINWEWLPADSVRAPEHRATWARVEISVGGEHVTLVEDRNSGSSRRSIYCPLYPLAEWMAYNWWFLQSDARPSRFLARDGLSAGQVSRSLPPSMRDHHSLRASGDGFAWPDLVIVPDEGETRLIWGSGSRESANWPVRFLSRGDVRQDSQAVMQELERLITETLTRLAEQGVHGTVLEKEWASIQQTDSEETDYCLASARLGLDPYADAEPYEQDILSAAELLSGRLLTDFLDAVSPDHIQQALNWLSRFAVESGTATATQGASPAEDADADALGELRGVAARSEWFGAAAGLPWRIGYQQARLVRARAAPDTTAKLDIQRYVGSQVHLAPDASLQALGSGAGSARRTIVLGQSRPAPSTRFTLSRALWHRIWDDAPSFVITTAHTRRQQIERAFAAELLAPADGIAELLESPPEAASQEEVEQIAQRYGVSSMVVDHQIRNHLIGLAA